MAWSAWLLRQKPLLHVAARSGSGAPVVLLHGIASSSVTYKFLVPQLENSHTVIAMDLLGFGGSRAPAGTQFTIDEHAEAVARTIEKFRLNRPVTLVGHSLGALISLRVAARFPRLVSHLVMVSPPVYVESRTLVDPLERVQMDAYQRLYDYMRANPQFTKAAASALEKISPIRNLVDVNEDNWEAFSASLEKCIESQTTVTDLAGVRCGIDLVYGTLDPFLVPAGMRVVERMRGVSTTRVEGADHVIRPKLAAEVARVINNPSPPTAPVRLAGG